MPRSSGQFSDRGRIRRDALSVWLLGSFGMPVMLMQGPGLAIIPNLYAREFGLKLAAMGFTLLVVRILFDAILTPVVGYLSDRTRTPWGPRKPWLLAGSVIGAFGVFHLYNPGQRPTLEWLAVWMSVVYAAWTLIEVSYTAWGAELTHDYDQRSKIFVVREGFINAGALLLALMPMVYSPTREMDFAVLSAISWWSVGLLGLFTLLCIWLVPHDGAVLPRSQGSPLRSLVEMSRNIPFVIFLLYTSLLNIAAGSAGAMFFLFMTTYLGLGSHFTVISLTSMVVATLSLPIWNYLLRRLSKKAVLSITTSLLAVQLLAAYLLRPGPGVLPMYMAFEAAWYTLFGASFIASRAMLGDLADYDSARLGGNRAGEYVAAWSLTCKATQAAGAAVGYAVASAFSFQPGQGPIAKDALFGLLLAYSGIPALMAAGAAIVALRFPLDRRRMNIIVRALERRQRRQDTPSEMAVAERA